MQTANTSLQNEFNGLQTSNAKLQTQFNSLQAGNATLQTQLAAVQSNHALALGPFVSVDPNPEIGVVGPNITFTGANIHIVSGSGSTDDNGTPRHLSIEVPAHHQVYKKHWPPKQRTARPTSFRVSGWRDTTRWLKIRSIGSPEADLPETG